MTLTRKSVRIKSMRIVYGLERKMKEKSKKKAIVREFVKLNLFFKKQNIFYLIYKRTCFLTGELNPCFSIASFEFLQEAKTLIKMLDSKVTSKINNVIHHMSFKAKSKKNHAKFISKLKYGCKHTRYF